MNINSLEAQSLIAFIQNLDKGDDLYTMSEIGTIFSRLFPSASMLDMPAFHQAKEAFQKQYFVQGALYWRVHPAIQNYLNVLNEDDPVWAEFISLSGYIRDNLYSTPFVVQCDDKDFLQGAMETALSDVGEECWFDWFITHEFGETYEINRFEG